MWYDDYLSMGKTNVMSAMKNAVDQLVQVQEELEIYLVLQDFVELGKELQNCGKEGFGIRLVTTVLLYHYPIDNF